MRRLHTPVVLAVAFTAGCALVGDSTVTAAGSDRYPSTTASDWVTYGDFVAVVRVDQPGRRARVPPKALAGDRVELAEEQPLPVCAPIAEHPSAR